MVGLEYCTKQGKGVSFPGYTCEFTCTHSVLKSTHGGQQLPRWPLTSSQPGMLPIEEISYYFHTGGRAHGAFVELHDETNTVVTEMLFAPGSLSFIYIEIFLYEYFVSTQTLLSFDISWEGLQFPFSQRNNLQNSFLVTRQQLYTLYLLPTGMLFFMCGRNIIPITRSFPFKSVRCLQRNLTSL